MHTTTREALMIPHVYALLRARQLLVGLLLYAVFQAAAVDIASKPLIIPSPLPPNVVLSVEEAGTMRRGVPPFTPNIADTEGLPAKRYHYSAHYNPLYYNPSVTYSLPKKPDGSNYSTPSFAAALKNGYNSDSGQVSLNTKYRPTYTFDPTSNIDTYGKHPATDVGTAFSSASAEVPAYYYRFNAGCNPITDKENEACYTLVWVGASSGPGGTDERQNFANWYSFYRTRYLATITALHLVMPKLEGKIRLAWQGTSLLSGNFCTDFSVSACKGRDGTLFDNRLKPFQGAHRQQFYSWLSRLGSGTEALSTSMRRALKRVGDYLSEEQRYCDDPIVATDPVVNPTRSCRDNIHIMISDGETRDGVAVTLEFFPSGEVDSVNILASPPSFPLAYTPKPPYMDYPKQALPVKLECYSPYLATIDCTENMGQYYRSEGPGTLNSGTLADIAFYYWLKDLAPALDNNVLPYMPDNKGGSEEDQIWRPRNNPAKWQHLVNYSVITGMSFVLGEDWVGNTYDGAHALGQKNWPYLEGLSSAHPSRIYDYWHAALNSRGQFYGVDEVNRLVEALSAIAQRIEERLAASAAIAANSTRLDTGTMLYQARYTSVDWTGELIASKVLTSGVVGETMWLASIPPAAERNLVAHNGTSAASFNSTALLPADWVTQVGVSGASANEVLAWLRGDQSQEQNFNAEGTLVSGKYRRRAALLGDIVNSDPVYVSNQDYGYTSLPGAVGDAYKTFVATNKNRVKMLYVGANDGMLHGFVAGSGTGTEHACGSTLGRELFAYIPNVSRAHMPTLANPAYGQPGGIPHRYYVDGSVSVGDAYLGGAWKTLLLGTTGAGGRTVFALDITNPCEFGPAKVLWERDQTWDADIGYTLAKPIIARLNNGKWAAVFGNGYNSDSGRAVLFIVDLVDGSLIKKFDVGGTDNGLAAPSLYDADGNGTTDAIYAGDLMGRMWKFDVSAASDAAWTVAFGGAPLFTAVGPSPAFNAQPITAAPELGKPPSGTSGVMVYFGTGRFFATGDDADHKVQSLYGLLDDGSSVITGRSELVAQSIIAEVTAGDKKVRKISTNPVSYTSNRGWYLDLNFVGASGERVISTPRRVFNRVFFTTLIPEADPCQFGGKSWLIELEPGSGAMPESSVIDVGGEVIAGIMSTVGIVKSFDFLSGEGAVAIGLGSTGATESIRLNPPSVSPRTGRISWREIID